MFNKVFIAVFSIALICFSVSANAFTVNLDATAHNTVDIAANTDDVLRITHTSGAWNPWNGAVSGCDSEGKNCTEGWINAFWIHFDGNPIGEVKWDNGIYATEAQAADAAKNYSVTGHTNYGFVIQDLLGSNIGNMSLAVKLRQTITDFTVDPATGGVGGTSTLSATGGDSGNPVTYTSLSSSICTVSGNIVSYIAVGDCTVAANQAGNDDYLNAAQQKITIQVGKTEQTITAFLATPDAGIIGGSSTLSATGGDSGNPVTYASSTSSICTVSDSTVNYLAIGTCIVTADQEGNDDFDAAPQESLNISVDKIDQVISSFTSAPDTGTVDGSSTLSATGGASGNPVTYSSNTPSTCTVIDATVSFVAAGTCTVAADQAGNDDYNAAPQESLTINVDKAEQTITSFASDPETGSIGGSSTLSATGGASGNPVIYASSTTEICTVSGSTITFITKGTCTITADQDGNDDYNAAPQERLNIPVGKIDQEITAFVSDPETGEVDGTSTLSATGGGSENPVLFASSTPEICTVNDSTVSFIAAGTCTVTADQEGDADYNPAQASLDITVNSEEVVPVKPIPTLSEWAMILLVLMLAGVGFLFGRNRLE